MIQCNEIRAVMECKIQEKEGCILVKLMWDQEAKVWIGTSDEVPGLVIESESVDKLIEKIKDAIPELI